MLYTCFIVYENPYFKLSISWFGLITASKKFAINISQVN